jgi:predicted SprT family Zn-dependent metalloprotease
MRIFADESRPNITRMFGELNELHFNSEIPAIPVVWNSRMTTTAGYCRYRRCSIGNLTPYKIDLSLRLFESNGFQIEEVKATLIHEMVHAYLAHKHNVRGHGPMFQREMTRITGIRKNHRCHNYDTSAVARKVRYTAVCVKCGYTYGYKRKPKYSSYIHRGCDGKMTIKAGDVPTEEKSRIKIF